jgi:hypothetical protein
MAKTDRPFDVLRIRGNKADIVAYVRAPSAEKAIENACKELKLGTAERRRLIARARG